MKRNILIAICLVLLAIVLMKVGPIGYMLSVSIFSLPIIINLFAKATDCKVISVFERKEEYPFRWIRSSRFFDYAWRIVIGFAYAVAIAPMLYLSSFADIVALLILIPVSLYVSLFIKNHSSFRKNYATVRTSSLRAAIICIIEVLLYPIIWIAVTSKGLFRSFKFGVLSDLEYSLTAYAIGSFVDLTNSIVDILSGFSMFVLFIPLFVGGGILFTGLYKYFEFFLKKKKKMRKAFSPIRRMNSDDFSNTVTIEVNASDVVNGVVKEKYPFFERRER